MFQNSIYDLAKDISCILGINAENGGTWISPLSTNPSILKEFTFNEQIDWPDFYTNFTALNDKNFTIDIEFLLTDISQNQYIFGQDTADTTFSLLALAKDINELSTIRLFAKNIIDGQIFTAYDIYQVSVNEKIYLRIKRNNGVLTVLLKENNTFKTLYTEYNPIGIIQNLPIISNGLPVFSKFNGQLFNFILKDEFNTIIYKLNKSDLNIQLNNLRVWPELITEDSPSGNWELQTKILINRNAAFNSKYHAIGFNEDIINEQNWELDTQIDFKDDSYDKTFIVNCFIKEMTNKNSIEYQTIFSQGSPTNLFNIINLTYIADRTSDNTGLNDYITFMVNNVNCIIPYNKFKNYLNSFITIIAMVSFKNNFIKLYLNNELITTVDFNDSKFNNNSEQNSNYFKLGRTKYYKCK